MENKYEVGGHPTLLFFDGNGKLVNRLVGASSKMDVFIHDMVESTKTENFIENYMKSYEAGKVSIDELYRYADARGLNHARSIAVDKLFERVKTNKELKAFFTKYKRSLFYFDIVNSNLLRFLEKEENRQLVASFNIVNYSDKTITALDLNNDINYIYENAFKLIMATGDYSPTDLSILTTYAKSKNNKVMLSLLNVLPNLSLGNKDAFINQFLCDFDTYSENEVFRSLLYVSKFASSLKSKELLNKYLDKCDETTQNKRVKDLIKRIRD